MPSHVKSLPKTYLISAHDNQMEAMAIVLTALAADNPTIASAWDGLRTAVMIAEGEHVAREIEFMQLRHDTYEENMKEFRTLRNMKNISDMAKRANQQRKEHLLANTRFSKLPDPVLKPNKWNKFKNLWK